MTPSLIPELDVSDLRASTDFYVDAVGFTIAYARPAEAFVCLRGHGATLMLQAADGPGRRFRTAALEPPFGRGVNFQLEVPDLDHRYEIISRTGRLITVPLETATYRVIQGTTVQRQFVVTDPDGYLLRLCQMIS